MGRIYGYIYIVENVINGKQYVGQTTDPDARRRAHFNGRSGCPVLQNAIEKYGSENFEFRILEEGSSLEELNQRETYWISELNTIRPQGYNIEQGGAVREMSEHSKRKIGEANKKYVRTPEYREKVRQNTIGKKNPFYGKRHTKRAKQKMREFRLNYTISDETRKKMSESHIGQPGPMLGRKHSAATRAKMSDQRRGKRNGMYGRKHSEEAKAKMRAAKKRRKENSK